MITFFQTIEEIAARARRGGCARKLPLLLRLRRVHRRGRGRLQRLFLQFTEHLFAVADGVLLQPANNTFSSFCMRAAAKRAGQGLHSFNYSFNFSPPNLGPGRQEKY